LDKRDIAYFKKVIELNPDYIEAYNGLGVALVKNGKIQEGMMQFKKVLDVNPYNRNAQKNIVLTRQLVKKNNDILMAP
jgi:superkiller protein 3